MARPVKPRIIEEVPANGLYAPVERLSEGLACNTLLLEELESLRLKDLEGYEQAECAEHMGVSRPTFQRILSSAREKVADSLLHGKGLNIEGGNFTQNVCPHFGAGHGKCSKQCAKHCCKRNRKME